MATYPDSDKVGDAAFEIAEIYAGSYFHDYESAAKYYIKSYQLNPYIKQPALLRAAETYDKMLADYERAKAIYQQAALYSPDAKSRKKAQDRLSVLEQGTAGKK
jgi:tetratricopeptide (TPR) repeat protein